LADVTTDWREKPKTWTERAIGLRSRVREPEKKNPKTISALEVAGKIGTVPCSGAKPLLKGGSGLFLVFRATEAL
jgi:hypothetical protein